MRPRFSIRTLLIITVTVRASVGIDTFFQSVSSIDWPCSSIMLTYSKLEPRWYQETGPDNSSKCAIASKRRCICCRLIAYQPQAVANTVTTNVR